MSQGLLKRLLICILTLGLFLYAFIDKQNEITELKMQIPKLAKEVKVLQEENAHLHYKINCFENPQALLNILRKQEYSHLKYPLAEEVIVIRKEER